MKKIIVGLFLVIGSSASAFEIVKSAPTDKGNKVGFGLSFSEGTGFSVYADTSQETFVQAAISFAPHESFTTTADYAYGYRNSISSIQGLTPYWGLGGVMYHDQNNNWSRFEREENGSTTYFGARIPLGLNFVIPKTFVQLSVEMAPSLLMTPVNYGYLQGGVSARILF